MFLDHVSFFCSSEEKSDNFYGNLLGLKRVDSRILPSVFVEKIFGISIELKMINYINDDIRIEVFVGDHKGSDASRIGHVCLEVGDREAFIKECEDMDLNINKILRDNSFILFVSDYDGNLFEIKEKHKS
jgi:catechol 2,3-dioxygenase-like lactoylglutathione lyase family enzyme